MLLTHTFNHFFGIGDKTSIKHDSKTGFTEGFAGSNKM